MTIEETERLITALEDIAGSLEDIAICLRKLDKCIDDEMANLHFLRVANLSQELDE